jgi:hypothetical protein
VSETARVCIDLDVMTPLGWPELLHHARTETPPFHGVDPVEWMSGLRYAFAEALWGCCPSGSGVRR